MSSVRRKVCILDREDVGRMAGFVVVRVPQSRRRHEHRVRLPVEPLPIGNPAVVVEPTADQRVAAGPGVDDEVDCHRLVAMRSLHGRHRQDPEHRPHDVGDRHRLRQSPVPQQN
jgi:hypothetical protein